MLQCLITLNISCRIPRSLTEGLTLTLTTQFGEKKESNPYLACRSSILTWPAGASLGTAFTVAKARTRVRARSRDLVRGWVGGRVGIGVGVGVRVRVRVRVSVLRDDTYYVD